MRPSFGYDTDRMKSVSVRFLFSPSFRLVFTSMVLIGVMLGQGLAQAKSCDEQFLNFQDSRLLMVKLPQPGSRAYRALSKEIEAQLEKTKSYAILDLSKIFGSDFARLWSASLPENSASQFMQGNILFRENNRFTSRDAFPSQSASLEAIQKWFRELIQSSLDRTLIKSGNLNRADWLRLGEGYANLRVGLPSQRSVDFDAWHLDGGGVSVTLAFKGPGTEVLGGVPLELAKSATGVGDQWNSICSGCKPFVVSEGHALILFGTSANGQDAKLSPTIHRTPVYSGARSLLVLRY